MTKLQKTIAAFFLSMLAVSMLILMFGFFQKDSNKSSQWEKFSTFFKTTKPNTSAYNVDAAGWDVRVVEWIPEDNKDYRCMFVAGTEKAAGGCYPASNNVEYIKTKLDF